ncbi:DNA-invertase hin [bacterium MnTg02]|nr:DNA-invertase hin [bacterium MnTg02]
MKIGYCRVSKDDQDLSLQKDALKAAGCEKIFAEKISGTKNDRPQLQAALDFAREGDTLIVWKLDRLGRSLSQLVSTVERLKADGIQFKCLSPAMDTTTSSGKLIFGIFATLAEFERDLIVERTKAGLEAAAARGRKGGRPPSMTPEKIRAAADMLRKGDNVSQIARVLNVSRQTIYRNVPMADDRTPRETCRVH